MGVGVRSHCSPPMRFLAFPSGKVPPGVFWACYSISTPCDQAFWRTLRGWKLLFMAGQGVCSTLGATFLVSKCVCLFLGGQAILGSQSRSLITFLDFTSPSAPKLYFFLPLIKISCSWKSRLLSSPKGLVSRAVEGYRPISHHPWPTPVSSKLPIFTTQPPLSFQGKHFSFHCPWGW